MLLVSFEAPSDSESPWGREHGRSIPFSDVAPLIDTVSESSNEFPRHQIGSPRFGERRRQPSVSAISTTVFH